MKYGDRKFSVGQTGRSPDVCAKVGHAEPNRHGKCFMCGTQLVPKNSEWNRVDKDAPLPSASELIARLERALLPKPSDFDAVVKQIEVIEHVKKLNVDALARGVGAELNMPAIAEWADEKKLNLVREFRDGGGCSLRELAYSMYEPGAPWEPPSNQLAGMDLCVLAGIDPY